MACQSEGGAQIGISGVRHRSGPNNARKGDRWAGRDNLKYRTLIQKNCKTICVWKFINKVFCKCRFNSRAEFLPISKLPYSYARDSKEGWELHMHCNASSAFLSFHAHRRCCNERPLREFWVCVMSHVHMRSSVGKVQRREPDRYLHGVGSLVRVTICWIHLQE